jgi:hypothetical protein
MSVRSLATWTFLLLAAPGFAGWFSLLAACAPELPQRSDSPAVQAEPVRSQQLRVHDTGSAFDRFAGSTFSVEQILRVLGQSALTDLRPVGTTSVVLRASLDAPFRAALKLATHERPLGPAAEAAAYRLSRCLGLTTVPPVVLRRLPYRSLEPDPRHIDRWAELASRLAVDASAQVEGAAIFWVEGMRELPIAEREPRQALLPLLLQGSALRADQQLMAAQISDLSVFDLLLGNGDRWSGGNVQGDASGQWLYIRDHDQSFATQLRPEASARLLKQLTQVERFSRGLIERTRALTAESYEREWSGDAVLANRSAWLRERVAPGVLARRSQLLAHVDGLVQRYGEGAVLVFP